MTTQAPASPPAPIPNNPPDHLKYGPAWDVETPDPITAAEMETPAYPVPATLVHYIQAVQELAGCTVGMAAIAVIGAINLALSNNWDVRSLAPVIRPISLFFVGSVESSGRKSTAFDLAWESHKLADREITLVWKSTPDKEDAPRADNNSPVSLVPEEPRRRRKSSPKAIRSNTTIEALFRSLAQGRHCQALAMAECGSLVGGWSFAKPQRMSTFSSFNELWDGSDTSFDRVQGEVALDIMDKRLTATLVGQRSVISSLILDPMAANGFSARILLLCDPLTRPIQQHFDWAENEGPWNWVSHLNTTIGRLRDAQDHGQEYASDAPKRQIVEPEPEALERLRTFMSLCHEKADSASSAHTKSFWERAPEQVARFAAMLSLWRHVANGSDEITKCTYNPVDVEEAIQVVQWHGEVLAAYIETQTIEQLTNAAKWVADRLAKWAGENRYFNATGLKLHSCITSNHSGDGNYIHANYIARLQTITLLEHLRYIQPSGAKGRWLVNQHLLAAESKV